MTDFDPTTAPQADSSEIYHIIRNTDGFRLVIEREDADEALAIARHLFKKAFKSEDVELVVTHDVSDWGETPPEEIGEDFEALGITESMAIAAAKREIDDDNHSIYDDELVSAFWVGGFWLQPSIALDQFANMGPISEERDTPDHREPARQLKALLAVLANETGLSPAAQQAIAVATPYTHNCD